MKPARKRIRLHRRNAAYDALMARSSEYKIQQRKESGGFRRPGSYNR